MNPDLAVAPILKEMWIFLNARTGMTKEQFRAVYLDAPESDRIACMAIMVQNQINFLGGHVVNNESELREVLAGQPAEKVFTGTP